MVYSVIFWYMYPLHNYQIKVISISITFYFLEKSFKNLPFIFIKIYITDNYSDPTVTQNTRT